MRQLVPQLILENYNAEKYHGAFSAVGLFVDISGFSTLTDTLMRYGPHGAEVLAQIMRRVFGSPSQDIFTNGGFIVGYAGDAFTALFPLRDDPIAVVWHAIAAAWQIQQRLIVEPNQETEYGYFPISAKVGLAVGETSWGILRSQDGSRAAYYFRGSAINDSAAAEHQAKAGEIVLSANIYARLRAEIEVEPLGDFYRLVGAPARKPAPLPIPAQTTFPETMKVFFPDDLLYQDLRSEFRQAVNIFIRLPEVDEQAMSGFMQTLYALQARYGGLFTRIDYGDKGCNILLFWGAPVAYENDIERALHFIHELKTGAEFPFTAGVTYYNSRAGFMGSDLMEEYTCYGWGINLAARLMLSAPPGEIWLDARVEQRAGQFFETRYVGEQKFKGIAQIQKVYALGSHKKEHEAFFQGIMVGRGSELQQLTEFIAPLWEGACAGPLTIWGDPGIGKSRLVYEFRLSALFSTHRATWAICQCDQILRESFNPFSYWLRGYFDLSSAQDESRKKPNFQSRLDSLLSSTPDSDLAAELDRTRSCLAALVGLRWPDSLYERLDARGRYDTTFSALTTLIKAESLRQPLIIFIEDAQYLDDDSKEFILHLMRSLKAGPGQFPVAIISASRREGAALPFEKKLLGKEIDLGTLSTPMLTQLAEAILGNPASSELIHLLAERSDGNPFFAEQILRYLLEERMLEQIESRWRLVPGPSKTTLPVDIRALLVARLDQLPRAVKNVIQTASVLGREFEIRVLAGMLLDDPRLIDEIKAAEQAAIWSSMSEIRYIFRHALLRDAAYNMQMQARRQELHALAVEALESVFAGQIEEHYGELAWHAEQACLTEKACFYLRRAGEVAQEAYQNNPAIDYFTRALALTPESDLESRYELLLARQKVYHLQAKSQEEEQDLLALQTIAGQLQDKARQMQVAIQYADYYIRTGDYSLGIEKSLAAIALAEESGRDDWKADAIVSLTSAYLQQGDFTAVLREAEKGLFLARKIAAREVESRLLNGIGLAILEQKNPAEALDYFEQSLSIAREIGNQRAESQTLTNLGMVAAYAADYAAAYRYSERALAINRQIGSRSSESYVLNNLGWITGLLGNFSLARKYIEQSLQVSREIDNQIGLIYGLINLSAYAGALGDYTEALDAARQSLLLAQDTHSLSTEAWALTYQGHALLALGQGSEARESYQAALQIRQETKQATLATEPYAGLARVALAQNDLSAARHWVEPILLHLEAGNTLGGTDEPLRVYLTCYQVLKALNDPRAHSMLETAYRQMMARAGNIQEETLRVSFLENIPYHRDILAAWEAEQTND